MAQPSRASGEKCLDGSFGLLPDTASGRFPLPMSCIECGSPPGSPGTDVERRVGRDYRTEGLVQVAAPPATVEPGRIGDPRPGCPGPFLGILAFSQTFMRSPPDWQEGCQ